MISERNGKSILSHAVVLTFRKIYNCYVDDDCDILLRSLSVLQFHYWTANSLSNEFYSVLDALEGVILCAMLESCNAHEIMAKRLSRVVVASKDYRAEDLDSVKSVLSKKGVSATKLPHVRAILKEPRVQWAWKIVNVLCNFAPRYSNYTATKEIKRIEICLAFTAPVYYI